MNIRWLEHFSGGNLFLMGSCDVGGRRVAAPFDRCETPKKKWPSKAWISKMKQKQAQLIREFIEENK